VANFVCIHHVSLYYPKSITVLKRLRITFPNIQRNTPVAYIYTGKVSGWCITVPGASKKHTYSTIIVILSQKNIQVSRRVSA